MILFFSFTILFFTSSSRGYGFTGHALTGHLTEAYLKDKSPQTWDKLMQIFPEMQGLAKEATWADDIRRLPSYEHWRDSLHYQDAKGDDEPQYCHIDTKVDCPEGRCLIPAIANYTERLYSTLPCNDLTQESVRMLIHLIGDLSQPLHLSSLHRGGTLAKVHFEKAYTTLHAVWDYKMMEKRVKDDFNYSSDKYRDYLINQMKQYPNLVPCSQPFLSLDSCPEEWAQEIVQLNCKYVWNNITTDLAFDYYTNAWPVQEQQLILASLRTARLLTQLFAPKSRLFRIQS